MDLVFTLKGIKYGDETGYPKSGDNFLRNRVHDTPTLPLSMKCRPVRIFHEPELHTQLPSSRNNVHRDYT